MPIGLKISIIRRIDYFIRVNGSGVSMDICKRLGISRRTFFRYLEFMKSELKAPIKFNARTKRYTYKEAGSLFIGFYKNKELTENEITNVSGGYQFRKNSDSSILSIYDTPLSYLWARYYMITPETSTGR